MPESADNSLKQTTNLFTNRSAAFHKQIFKQNHCYIYE